MLLETDRESYFGIFIKEVIRNSLAEREGKNERIHWEGGY